MVTKHQQDHSLIAESIAEDWLARERLLVHIAREHGFTVGDVANDGLATLIHTHDEAHSARCFENAELASPSDGLRNGLKILRERS